jgi:putative transposase
MGSGGNMRKTRNFVGGAAYHVTSRTNDKKRIFESVVGEKVILLILQEARKKFGFQLRNFCIMPTHLHLLIIPGNRGTLSQIMHWVKTNSAKRWNRIQGATDHLWGQRYFARIIEDPRDYFTVMKYIDQNPVKSGLAHDVGIWKASGAYWIINRLPGLVDYTDLTRLSYIKQLPAPTPSPNA